MTTETPPATECPRLSSLRNASEAALVARCRDGDQDAWTELVARFSHQTYAIARRAYGLHSHDAEELFQETFARAFQNLHALRDPDAFGYWIRKITRRLCVDHLRRAEPLPLTTDDLEDEPGDDLLERLDDAMAVHQALACLPGHAREVIDRFFFRDEPYESISQALQLPYGTIASRISRGLERLRENLAAEER